MGVGTRGLWLLKCVSASSSLEVAAAVPTKFPWSQAAEVLFWLCWNWGKLNFSRTTMTVQLSECHLRRWAHCIPNSIWWWWIPALKLMLFFGTWHSVLVFVLSVISPNFQIAWKFTHEIEGILMLAFGDWWKINSKTAVNDFSSELPYRISKYIIPLSL